MLPGRGHCGRLQEGVRLLRITDSPMTCLKIGGFANGHYSKAAGKLCSLKWAAVELTTTKVGKTG